LTIRPATAADAETLVRLGRASTTAPQWSERQYRELFEQGPGRRLVLVAQDGDSLPERAGPSILGFLVAAHVPPEWELESVVVDEAVARRGVGTRLVRELIAHAEGDAISLEVRAGNAPARGLYEKCGFGVTGVRKAYYSSPVEDAVTYRRGAPKSEAPASQTETAH